MKAARSITNPAGQPLLADSLLRNSLLYRELQAEREEILKHKWLESEKAGYDIGWAHAAFDWRRKHRSHWLRWRRQTRRAPDFLI